MSRVLFRAICQAALAFYNAASIPLPEGDQSEITRFVIVIWEAWRDLVACIRRLPAAHALSGEESTMVGFPHDQHTHAAMPNDNTPLEELVDAMSAEERTALQAVGFAVRIYHRQNWSRWTQKCRNMTVRMKIMAMMGIAGRWAKQGKDQAPRQQMSDLEKTVVDRGLSKNDLLLPLDDGASVMFFLRQLHQIWEEPFPDGD